MKSLKSISTALRDTAAARSTSKGSGGGSGKRVRWAADVRDPASSGGLGAAVLVLDAALENDHMVYTIKIRQKDCEWNISRRYSEFAALHAALLEESLLAASEFPSLPKKRWFELSRWTQRHDDTYTLERRNELQQYLQKLFSINKRILVQKSKALQRFLEFHNRYKLSVNNVWSDEMDVSWKGSEETSNSDSEIIVPQSPGVFDGLFDTLQSLQGSGRDLVGAVWQRFDLGDSSTMDATTDTSKSTVSPPAIQPSIPPAGDRVSISTGTPTDTIVSTVVDDDNDHDKDGDCDSEGSVDSGFGEHDMKFKLTPSVKSALASGPADEIPSVTQQDNVNAVDDSGFGGLVRFAWEACKSDYWMFIIAFVLLLLSKYGWIPENT